MKTTIDAKHGRFTLYDNDRWLGRSLIETGVYSEQEVELLCSLIRDGDTVAEVGANFGSITIPLAKAVGSSGKVYAFEPQPQINALLVENVAQNRLMQVIVSSTALSDANGAMSMAKIDWEKPLLNSGGAELVDAAADHGDQFFSVLTKTLDSFGLERLDLMKVDVEGHELRVLRGAAETIRIFKPILYVENDRPHLSRDLLAFLINDLGYRCWWHFPDLYNANEPFDGADIISHNMLCVHKTHEPPKMVSLREAMSEHDSAALASQRVAEAKIAGGFVHRHAPVKRANEWACIVRLGGVGDNLIASSVLPYLKRKWGHVEVIAAEPQHVVFENNPHIDKLTMLPQGYPPWEDGIKWQEHWLMRSKEYAFFANLSHTCENLVALTRTQTPYYWAASMRRKLCGQNYVEAVGDVCEAPYDELEPGFFPTEAESEAAEKTKKLVGGRYIGWVLSGTRVDKVWPPAASVIARLLKDTDLPVIMIGGPGRDFEMAKHIQEQVRGLNGSDRNLHLALSSNIEFPNWPIRRVLAQTLAADIVVSPDTGPAWAAAKKPMSKVVLLSHASKENITKGWTNTVTLHADASVACWPCHLLIDRPEDCERLSGRKGEAGAACISSIKPDAVIEAVRKAAANL